MRTVLHVSPHPDDESIGVPCTLLALRRAGWRVVNLACGLGRLADHERRLVELGRALKVADFESLVHDPPVALSQRDDHRAARRTIAEWVGEHLLDPDVELVVGPHPQDGHHGHVTVAKAIADAVQAALRPPVWWMWSIWAELPRPTILAPCAEEDLLRSAAMLEEHCGENARNDYRVMHRPVREVNAVRGAEQVFGFGSGALPDVRSAELLTEMTWLGGQWYRGRPRVLTELETTELWEPVCDTFLGTRPRRRRVIPDRSQFALL